MAAFITAALIAGAASAGIAALGFGVVGVGAGAAFLSAFATSAVVGGIAYAMRDKPASASLSSVGRAVSVRQPISYWQIIVGEARVGGTMTYMYQSGNSLWIVYTLAGHVSEDIVDVYFDDERLPLAATAYFAWESFEPTGDYAGYVRITKSLGNEAGQPFQELVNVTGGEWTDAHRQTGRTKILVGLTANAALFPNGIPNVTAVIKGVRVTDRVGSPTGARWSDNPAQLVAEYLTNSTWGLGADYDTEINAADLIAASNACDEQVALAGSPVVYENRYTCNGAFVLSAQPKDILGRMLAAMAGKAVAAGSQWHIYAGVYTSPSITLDEGDLAGAIRVQSLVSRRDNCNGVKGTFTDPLSHWQPTDFPRVASATYMAQDNGERVWHDLDLTAFVTSGTQAQRLAKIDLLRTRQGYTAVLPCKLTAWAAMTGRTVMLDNTQFGWSSKPFDVEASRFTVAGDGTLGVELTLRETAAAVYDWSTSEESAVDIAPNFSGDLGSFGAAPSDELVMLHFDGANGATTTTDEHGHPCSFVGGAGANISTAYYYAGSASLLSGAGNTYVKVTGLSGFGGGSWQLVIRVYWPTDPTDGYLHSIIGALNGTNFVLGVDAWGPNVGTTGSLRISFGLGGGTKIIDQVDYAVAGTAPFVEGVWHGLTIAYDKMTSAYTFSWDGATVHSLVAPRMLGLTEMHVGANPDSLRSVNGYIDEVSLLVVL